MDKPNVLCWTSQTRLKSVLVASFCATLFGLNVYSGEGTSFLTTSPGIWDLTSPTQGWNEPTAMEVWGLNHGPPGKSWRSILVSPFVFEHLRTVYGNLSINYLIEVACCWCWSVDTLESKQERSYWIVWVHSFQVVRDTVLRCLLWDTLKVMG